MDPDGLLEASARDMHAGISRNLVIARIKRHQNDEDVERLVLAAKQNKANDIQFRRQIQVSTLTSVNSGSIFALRHSTLDFCIGGQRSCRVKRS